MFDTIVIEGIRVKGTIIPDERLFVIWTRLTLKPFPRVRAFRLDDSDFDRVVNARKCKEDERRELKEWGRALSTRGTDACVFNVDDATDVDYIILIRKNPYHNPTEVLKHELSHIARGDL